MQKVGTSKCWLWLCYQAQMVDLRSDLIESRSKNAVLEKELQTTLEQLHTTQLQMHASSGHVTDAESVRKKLVCFLVYFIMT